MSARTVIEWEPGVDVTFNGVSIVQEKFKELLHRHATKSTLKRWALNDLYCEQLRPYTYVSIVLVHPNGRKAFGTGFAKQRPTDRWNSSVGFNVALSRAVTDALSTNKEKNA